METQHMYYLLAAAIALITVIVKATLEFSALKQAVSKLDDLPSRVRALEDWKMSLPHRRVK